MAMDHTLHQLIQGQLRSHQLSQALHVWDLEEDLGALRARSLEGPAAPGCRPLRCRMAAYRARARTGYCNHEA